MARSCLLFFSLILLFGQTAAGQSAAADEDPVAVVALVKAGGDAEVLRLTAAVQRVLSEAEGLSVLSAEETTSGLAGGAAAGPGQADMERLEGLFRQGYLQSYSFEYRAALKTLERVLTGLRRVRSGPARWRLWEKARIFQGISYAGLGDEAEALRAFAIVLRTRPSKKLARRDYSPKTIARWNKARDRLSSMPQGQLAVESEPSGAEVLLDGQLVGQTPLIAHFPHGRYHLQLRHAEAGEAARWISLGREATRIRLQLLFEGSLVLDGAQAAVRLPAGADDLPLHWWSWLGVRLGVRRLVAIRSGQSPSGQIRYIASLVDLERGRKLREGWLTPSGPEPLETAELNRDARDLASFVSTGRASERLGVAGPFPDPAPGPADSLDDPGTYIPALPFLKAARPWYRKWWTWASAAAAFAGLGAGSTLAWDDYDRRADKATNADARASLSGRADSWRDVSITAFSISAAVLVTGVILHLTYEAAEFEAGSAGGAEAALLWRF